MCFQAVPEYFYFWSSVHSSSQFVWRADHGRLLILRWECGDAGIVSNNRFVLGEQIKALRVLWTCPTCPAAPWARADHKYHLKKLFLRWVLSPQLVGWYLISCHHLAALLLALDANMEIHSDPGQLQNLAVRSLLLSEASGFWLTLGLGSSVTSPWFLRLTRQAAPALGFAPGALL